MSRIACSFVLIASLTSSAFATGFAKAPSVAPAVPADTVGPIDSAELRVPEDRVALPSRAQVRAALAKARAVNLAHFRGYAKAGKYPSNVYTNGAANVWRDQAGNFCAAATIMFASGFDGLATQIAEDNNFFRLADVEQGPVMDWILMSGFTQAELVMIQKPFMPVAKQPEVAPTTTIAIDARMRARETARLRAKYKAVDRQLVAKHKQSLELAIDRLMKNPALAWRVVEG